MKILAINSSFRGSRGFTAFLLEKLFEGAREKGAECEIVNLAELKINRCIDCQACQRADHYLKCIHNGKDDVDMVYDKMRSADIIIFGTPVYTFGMSSLLKMLLERYYSTAKVREFRCTKSGLFFHHVDDEICGKPFVSLVVCDNLEDETPKNAVSFFKTYSKFMDAPQVGCLVRKSAGTFGFNKAEKSKNKKIPEVYEAYREAGKELAVSGRISKGTQKKANTPMIKPPFYAKLIIKLGLGRDKITEHHDKMMETVIDR